MSSVTITQISTNTDLGVALGDISFDGEVVSYITKPTAAGRRFDTVRQAAAGRIVHPDHRIHRHRSAHHGDRRRRSQR